MSTMEPIDLPSGVGSSKPARKEGEMTAQDTKRRVLVVEDEMLIAMLLEDGEPALEAEFLGTQNVAVA